MKLFTAVVLSMLVGGVAHAHQKSNKKIGAIVVDRAGNALEDLGEYPSEIGEFARANDCVVGGQNSRCIYQMPINGVVRPAFVTLGDFGGELALLVTEVPGRMLDAVQTSFEVCEANPRDNIEKTVCAGFAWTFHAAGHLVYTSGYYVAESVVHLGRAAGESVRFVSDALDAVTRGQLDAAIGDLLHGVGAMPLCYALSLFVNGIDSIAELFGGNNGERLDCAEDVRKNRGMAPGQPKEHGGRR